ncbi:DJ-1/PfpI family protein [Nonomuraea cavernae]|uniref:DJ-1/PfpI family protein n=1 Tax=Nonomuraea cavernae TaxID=2045107 RepID=UPI0033E146B6
MSGTPRGADPVRVVILAYPGVDDLDLFGAYAVLSKAASIAVGRSAESDSARAVSVEAAERGLEVRIAASALEIITSGGVSFAAQAGLDALGTADAVLVPGGRGVLPAAGNAELTASLRQAFTSGAHFYGVCSGTILLAAAGLTRRRRVAMHHGKRHQLAGSLVGELTSGLVRDGRITTVGGDRRASVKSADLAFQLLADLLPRLLDPVSARMEVVPGRDRRLVVTAAGGR